jgi:hypothetical protein
LESFIYLWCYLSCHLHLQILFLGGNPMKFKFQMLPFWPSKFLRFEGPKLKLNVFNLVGGTLWCCHLQVQNKN